MLSRFSELGHSQTGARATANVQAEVWYNALHAIARYVEDVFQLEVKRLVDINYSGSRRYPKLHAAGIESRNLLEFAQGIALLGNAKFLAADTPTRDWVRDAIDAPKENPEEAQRQREMEAQQFELEKTVQLESMKPDEPANSAGKPRTSKSSTSTPTNK